MVLILNTLLFLILCFIWSSRNWLNTFIKIGFFVMSGSNLFILAKLTGYVIQV